MNAIILAAGLGSRFKDLTKNCHKALFKIDEVPNIERTIKFLHEIGVNEIYIVVGYLYEQFEYLKERFNVKLIYNNLYKTHNNLSSFYLALPHFKDSFVIDGDVVMLKNFLQKEEKSTYYTILRRKSEKMEWVVKEENGRVVDVSITNENLPSLLGISFFKKDDAKLIKSKIESLDKNSFSDPALYWDNVVIEMLDVLEIASRQIDEKFACEMDDVDDLQEVEQKIKRLK